MIFLSPAPKKTLNRYGTDRPRGFWRGWRGLGASPTLFYIFYFYFKKCVPTRWNSVYQMLSSFREQRKALLAMQFERDKQEAGISVTAKRLRLDVISSELPTLSSIDFELLRHVCPILKIFDTETQRVRNFIF